MPLVNDSRPAIHPGLRDPDESFDPDAIKHGALQIFTSGFEEYNPISAAVARGVKPNFVPIDGYDPLGDDKNDIEGYEPYAESFMFSESPAETQWIKSTIDREVRNRDILMQSGVTGIVASVAGGFTSPALLATLLVPGGGQTIAGRALFEGFLVGSGELMSEAALQGIQETRTLEQSAINVVGGALFAGVLGGVSSSLSRAEQKQVKDVIVRDLLDQASAPDKSAISRRALSDTTDQITALDVPDAVSATVSVMDTGVRLMRSPNPEIRRATEMLVETPARLTKNRAGEPTFVAAETRIKQAFTPVSESIDLMRNSYAQMMGVKGPASFYRAWVKGQRPGSMSYREFRNEVGRAMRYGDTHSNPYIQAAARSFRANVFDPLKTRAQKANLLGEDIDLLGADSYLTRMYDFHKIKQNPQEFTNAIAQYLQRDQGYKHEVAQEAADIVYRSLLDVDNVFGIPKKIVPKAGMLKDREIDIPDRVLEPWLESDIEVISRVYTRRMATEVELAETFGDREMREAFARIERQHRKSVDEAISAGNTKLAARLEEQHQKDRKALVAIRDMFIGTYGMPRDPMSGLVRGARFLRAYNYMLMLGGQVISSFPDMARPIVTNGLRGYLKAMAPMMTDAIVGTGTLGSKRIAPKALRDVKRMGVGLDMTLHTRMRAFADLSEIPTTMGRLEVLGEAGTSVFSKVSLMDPWNSFFKQWSGTMASDRLIAMALKEKRTKAELAQAAWLGLSEKDLITIGKMWTRFGEKESGFHVANIASWPSSIRDKFSAAVLKEADFIIITPGKAERPLWAGTEWGKTIMQFKSFAMAATNRMAMSGLSQRDLNVINSLLFTVFLGSVVTYIKRTQSGRDTDDIDNFDSSFWIESIDRGGALGIMMEPVNIVRHIGGYGPYGGSPREMAGEVFGPSIGTMESAGSAVQGALRGMIPGEEPRATNVHAVRKLIPYQNLFYTRHVLDRAEHEVIKALGLEGETVYERKQAQNQNMDNGPRF